MSFNPGAVPEIPTSPFRNTDPDAAHYTGSQRCTTCHSTEADAFAMTHHAHSLSYPGQQDSVSGGAVSASRQFVDAVIPHQKSGYQYATRFAEGNLIHQEQQLTDQGPVRDHVISHIVGSGQFGNSFLTTLSGFLVQSPLTWYTPRQCLDMSPGFDHVQQSSFHRTISARCLFCHSGIVETENKNDFFVKIREPAIGCERCHGPGSLHIAKHEQGISDPVGDLSGAAKDGIDYSIVNPSHLSRDLSDAICQQCHLQADANVLVRGRQFDSFRPGLPLSVFRQEFRYDAGTNMTVVGHVEQLQASPCYQQTESLSCVTCHHPHKEMTAEVREASYRNACLNCHTTEACQEMPDLRQAVADRCTDCHMPSAPTEVPHVAFTHHRIGVHRKPVTDKTASDKSAVPTNEQDKLTSLTPEELLPVADQARGRGLAWLHVAFSNPEANAEFGLKQARDLLTTAWDQGAQDAAVANGLAKIAKEIGWNEMAQKWAALACEIDQHPTDERMSSLAILSEYQFATGNYAAALPGFVELTKFRREARHWLYRGMTEQNLDRTEDAMTSMLTSVEIDPANAGTHYALSALYRIQKNTARETYHRRQAEQLTPRPKSP